MVHLHWINNGFLRIEDIGKINKPVVWSLHDSWAFTGGCHLPYNCKATRIPAGSARPFFQRQKMIFRPGFYPEKKVLAEFSDHCFKPVVRDCVRSSSVFKDFRVEIIPNILDTDGLDTC